MFEDTGGSLWFVSLSITHTLISFVVRELNAPQQSVVSLPFVLQCGNFAVLVDLHVLPLGGREDAGWFPADHIQVQAQRGGRACEKVCEWIYMAFVQLRALSKVSSSVESEMTLSPRPVCPAVSIVAKRLQSLQLASSRVALLTFHSRLQPSRCLPIAAQISLPRKVQKQQRFAVLKHPHTVCRRLRSWFEMPWTGG